MVPDIIERLKASA